MQPNYRPYYWLVIFALGFSGCNLLFRQAALEQVPAFPLLIGIMITATCVGLPLSLYRWKNTRCTWSHRITRDLIILALSATVIPFWLQIEGFNRTTATKGGIILSLIPLLTTIFSAWFIAHRVTRTQLIHLIIMTAGGVLLSLEKGLQGINTGDLMIFTAAVCFAFSMVVAYRVLQLWPRELVIQGRLTLACLILLAIWPFVPHGPVDPARLSVISLAGGILTYIFISAIYHGMKRLGPPQAAMFDILAALITAGGAWYIWGEGLQLIQWFGAALIVGTSIDMILRYRPIDEPAL